MSWFISSLVAALVMASVNATENIRVEPGNFVGKTVVIENQEQPEARQERFDQTYQLAPGGKVALNNLNGEVRVEGWDRSDVRVEALKTIDCDKPQDIEIKIDSTPNLLKIETKYSRDGENIVINNDAKTGRGWSYYNGNRCRKFSVDYVLSVPRAAQIDEIETVNGNVQLAGMTNLVKAGTVNGRVTAANLGGALNLSSVNGTVSVSFDRLENVREVKLGVVNGKIDLLLPSDADAVLRADTVNGAIANDFNLPFTRGEYVGRNLHGKLGDGKLPVKLSGVNGAINIRRQADGRQPKPVVNLLPAKRGNSDNDDDDDDVAVAPKVKVKPPKPPQSAVDPSGIADSINGAVGDVINDTIRDVTRESVRSARERARAAQELRRLRDLAQVQREVQRELREAFEMERYGNFGLTEKKSESFSIEGVPNVTVNARGGSVSVRGWDKPEVSYSLIHRAGDAEDLNVSATKNGSNVNLIVNKAPSDFRLEVFVPRKSDLQVVSSRAIRVEGVTGNLRLDGGDQSIDVRDAGGTLAVNARDARVRVIGFEGAAAVKTTDGAIALEGNFSRAETDTISGSAVVTLPDDAAATIEATTKNVRFDGFKPSGEPRDTKNSTIWRLGDGKANGGNFVFRTTAGGAVVVRSLGSVRVTRCDESPADSGVLTAE